MGLRKSELDAVTVGGARRLDGRIILAEYDPGWPTMFEMEAAQIRAALGDVAIRIEHVGSTAVPGLAAKPIIDIVMEVPDSRDESSYEAPLQAHGYVLRIREPDWFEHRMLKGPEADINLHVFTAGSPEVARMLRFRDHLRRDADDRMRYEAVKRQLETRKWEYVQDYADAKTEIIREIMERAEEDGG